MGFPQVQSESSRAVIIARQIALAWLKNPDEERFVVDTQIFCVAP